MATGNEKKGRAAEVNAEISALLRARNPLIWLATRETERPQNAIVDAAEGARMRVRYWSCARGIFDTEGRDIAPNGGDPTPMNALNFIRDSKERAVYVLRDFHAWTDPVSIAALKDLALQLQSVDPAEARAVIVLSYKSEIPPEIEDLTAVVDYPLPDRAEIGAILDGTISALPEAIRASAAPNGTRDRAVDAACGLTAKRAESAYAMSLVQTRGKVDASIVASEKKRVISSIPGVTWYEPDARGLDGIAGLDSLKAWLSQRKSAFTKEARAYGLPTPKGAFLAGIPGCGKSLTAKCIAAAWGLPLLRLDLGATKSKFVGDSEANIRRALAVAETVAPCVVWLDEIEKSLAGSTGSQGDGGVSADALGAILSWMQEKTAPVFVIATANDISALPPELLRKGRFDEVFFVDLPNAAERRAIVDVTLRSFDRDPSTIDGAAVALACEGFAGAEVAALVPEALFAAFSDGARPLATADLLESAAKVVPLAKTASDKIERLRAWGKVNARAASSPVVASVNATPNVRRLDLA